MYKNCEKYKDKETIKLISNSFVGVYLSCWQQVSNPIFVIWITLQMKEPIIIVHRLHYYILWAVTEII